MTANTRLGHEASEDGAILVLVLFFVVGIGLALAALVGFAGTNLSASGQLQTERNAEYSADAAMEGAIQAVRSVPPSVPPSCPNFPSSGTFPIINDGGVNLVAACQMGSTFASGRTVDFAVCPAPTTSFSACMSNAQLVAVIEYGDTGCNQGTDTGCSQYGNTVTIESWVVEQANG